MEDGQKRFKLALVTNSPQVSTNGMIERAVTVTLFACLFDLKY